MLAQAQIHLPDEDLSPISAFLDKLGGKLCRLLFAHSMLPSCHGQLALMPVQLWRSSQLGSIADAWCVCAEELKRRMLAKEITGGLPALELLSQLLFGLPKNLHQDAWYGLCTCAVKIEHLKDCASSHSRNRPLITGRYSQLTPCCPLQELS